MKISIDNIPKYINTTVNIDKPPANPPNVAKAHSITKNVIIDVTVSLLYLNTSLIIDKTETTLLFISPLQLNIVNILIIIINGAINGINGINNKPNQKITENNNTNKQPVTNLIGLNELSQFGLPVSLVFEFIEKNQDI